MGGDIALIIFGRAFFKKLARVWDAESHGNGISFLQSFFLCACGLKEKSVSQVSIARFDCLTRKPPHPQRNEKEE
jgi:hypothetical protein